MSIKAFSMPMEEVQKDCEVWAKEIAKQYIPDLIVFIAKSGYMFAEPMTKIFKCNMVDIEAFRPANDKKNKLKKVIYHIPEKLVLKIVSSRFMYRFNEKKIARDVNDTERLLREKNEIHKKILIVDDSVDTGWTLKEVINHITKLFPESEIKVASYSVIHYSKCRVNVDFYRYEDTVILTATSRKSDEYDRFVNGYLNWINKEKH